MYEPLEEYRRSCSRILITSRGEHTHPIPLPTKTPPPIRAEILHLLKTLDEDLPDLTPRRFLRHSATQLYLRQRLPHLRYPTLIDIHPSLSNRDHIRAYILQAQEACCPVGTGWEGEDLPQHNLFLLIVTMH
jgi:hypothetical protein